MSVHTEVPAEGADRSARIDQPTFREVLGHYPTGVVVVTGMSPAGEPLGMVVGSFSSVSLVPPLVSFMPMTGSQTYGALRECPVFCINVLAHDQRDMCRVLSSRDPRKFDGVGWSVSEYGAPVLDEVVARIHCHPESEVEAGDHLIVLCRAVEVEVVRPVTPLLFFQGGYGGFSPAGMTARVDASLISAVKLAEVTRPQLDRLAEQYDCSAEALVQITERDLTIGAGSYGPQAQMDVRLGVRAPLMPPLGAVSVAWSPGLAERWLSDVRPTDEHVVARYRARLAAIRAAGYDVSLIPPGGAEAHDRLRAAISEYAEGPLTPARERAVSATIAAAEEYLSDFVPPAAKSIDVSAIVAPVFDPTVAKPTNSGMVLSLRNLPHGVSGAALHEWIRALRAAAAEVTLALAGPARGDFDRYVASGLRDLR